MRPSFAVDLSLSALYFALLVYAAFGFWWNRRSFYFLGMLVFFLRCLFVVTSTSASSLLSDMPSLIWALWGWWFVVEWAQEWTVKVRSPHFRRFVVAAVSWCVLMCLGVFVLDYVSQRLRSRSEEHQLLRYKTAVFGVFFLTLALALGGVAALLYTLLHRYYRAKRAGRGFAIVLCGAATVIYVLLRGVVDLVATPNSDDVFTFAVLSSNDGLFFQEIAPSFTLLTVQVLLPNTLNPGANLTLLPPPMAAGDDFLLDIAVTRRGGRRRRKLSVDKLAADADVRKIAIDELDDQPLQILGRGSSGVVYRARWLRPEDGGDPAKAVPVAVKVMQLPQTSFRQDALDKFVLEVLLTARLSRRSDYICYLHGVVLERFETHREIRLVSELMESDLSAVCSLLSPSQKIIALLHIAKGVHFLHSCKPPIIHRDLKTANVLVGSFQRRHPSTSTVEAPSSSLSTICKIADLGVSTLASEWEATTRIGTPYVMAPEVIRMSAANRRKYSSTANYEQFHSSSSTNVVVEEPQYGTAVDIYAWAIIANEVWTGNPFLMSDEDRERYQFHSRFDEAIISGVLRPIIPPSCPQALASLIRDCWNSDPAMRPQSHELVLRLRRMMIDRVFDSLPNQPPPDQDDSSSSSSSSGSDNQAPYSDSDSDEAAHLLGSDRQRSWRNFMIPPSSPPPTPQ